MLMLLSPLCAVLLFRFFIVFIFIILNHKTMASPQRSPDPRRKQQLLRRPLHWKKSVELLSHSSSASRQGFWLQLILSLSVLWYTSVKKTKKSIYDCVIVVLLSSLLLIFPTSCFSKVSVSHFEVPQRSNRARTRVSPLFFSIYICSGHSFIHIVHRQSPQNAQSAKFATVPF